MGPLRRNLHLKIVFLFVVAILPAATLAIILAISNYQEARNFKDAALMQSAQLVAAREGALIESMRQVLVTLASQDSISNGRGNACGEALGAAITANPAYSSIRVINRQTRNSVCAAGSRSPATREDNAGWIELLADQAEDSGFALAANTLEEQQTIAAAVPLGEDDGRMLILYVSPGYLGTSTLFVPYLNNAAAALLSSAWDPISLYFTSAGVEWLPQQGHPSPDGTPSERLVSGRGGDGRQYRYAAVPIEETDLFVLSAAPLDRLYSGEQYQLITSIAFPLALLLVSVATAWIAVDRLVLRWILDLRETAADYGQGELDRRAGTPPAMPSEIKDLADTFNAMAGNIQERSAELERAVEAKSQLLRELHHRVKNNFQVIASLLALQKRGLPPEQRDVLRYSEDRVQAMATAYRVSYASGEIGNVGVASLVQEILIYMRQSSEAPAHLLRSEIETHGAEVDLDTAIPLALLMVEVMMPLADEARLTGTPAHIHARVDAEGALEIAMQGGGTSRADAVLDKALSSKLVRAFVQQVDGRLERRQDEATPQTSIHVPASRMARDT